VGGAVAPGGLEPPHYLPGAIDLHALVGQRRAPDVAERCSSRWRSSASQRTAACCAEALMVGTQLLGALDV